MKHAILDLDTQKEFLTPEGLRFVSRNGREAMVSDMIRAIKESIFFGSIHISTTIVSDMHNVYCREGSVGVEKMENTIVVEPEYSYNCANIMHGVDMSLMSDCWHINFEKRMSDIWDPLLGQPDNLETVLRSENIGLVTVVGVNCDDGLCQTLDGLLQAKYHVQVILDAIWDVDNAGGQIKLRQYASRGVKFIQSVDEFVEDLKGTCTPRNEYE